MDNKSYEDILKGLEPERVDIINRCISKIQGKNEMEILGIVTEAAKEFTSAGKAMSSDERKALIYAMKENLAPEQRKKFDTILNMLGMK